MEIEINGVLYRQKEQAPTKSFKPSKTLMALMIMSEMAYGYGMAKSNKSIEMPPVDIIKEYELIQLKRSKLSRNQRNWVVWQFEKNYERV